MVLLALVLVCGGCHREVAERYERTPMARSSGPAESVPPGRFFHAPSKTEFVIKGGSLRWPGGSIPLQFHIGSGRMGRSFTYSDDGYLYQAPAGFYGNRQAWDMAPGYESDTAVDVSRPVTAACLFCHADRPKPEPGTLNRYAGLTLHGVTCDRCHSDGETHGAIVNPAKLAPRLRDSVCEQCHLAGEARIVRRDMSEFRAGQDLSNYIAVFVEGTRGVRVNSHAESLAVSACKRGAGDRLWCGTCHSPHRAIEVNVQCAGCHANAHEKSGCVDCHMKKSRASDGGHTVFTDHAIGGGAKPGPLRPYYGTATDRDLGLALAQIGARRRDPAVLEKAWSLLRAAASAGDAPVLSAIAGLLRASGKREQAGEYYRRALAADPDNIEAIAALGLRDRARKLLGPRYR